MSGTVDSGQGQVGGANWDGGDEKRRENCAQNQKGADGPAIKIFLPGAWVSGPTHLLWSVENGTKKGLAQLRGLPFQQYAMRDQSLPSEQRKHQRTAVSCTVRLSISDAGDKESAAFSEVSAGDISLGGMFVKSETSLDFGVSVTLFVNEGTRGAMALPAVVRWNTAGGFGVQFGLLGARDTHALLALIKKTAT